MEEKTQCQTERTRPKCRKLSLATPDCPTAAPVPRFRLQILPAIEIGPRLHTWVARASFLSPPLRGWPPSQRKALEGTVWRGGRGATASSSRPDFIVHLREELWPGWFPYEASGEGSRSFQCSLPYLSRKTLRSGLT